MAGRTIRAEPIDQKASMRLTTTGYSTRQPHQ